MKKRLHTSGDKKIDVTYFQRKPRNGFNFSVEHIFDDVRERLKDKINASVRYARFYNNGVLSKFGNSLLAAFSQGKGVNHITGEVHFLDIFMKKSTVVLTILDCGYMHRKTGISKWLTRLIYLDLPVSRSKYITAISSETKNEVIKYTGCSAGKIHIIPVAVDELYTPQAKPFNKTNPVILQIGTGPNKNLQRLAQSLNGIDCILHIVGRLSDDQKKTLEQNRIAYKNFYNLSQAEMLQQYINCDIVSFVSTFEGFGMPIVEANCVERAVITSNISSMPEVAGDAACLVDPYNTGDIRNGIMKLVNDDAYRDQLIANGRKNRLRFEAQRIAEQYYALYKKIAAWE
ncbi:MAG TPA: glycosyltransferase [Chitinophagaceae bacterium]|nr:glycosyltransferase [Chitinophagaceae bacterium]